MLTWNNKSTGGYARDTQEAHDNAIIIASILMGMGWSLASACAVLGNIQGESGINPWRWEGDYVPTYSEANGWTPAELTLHGYGLFQYTGFDYYSTRAYMLPGFGINYSDIPGSPFDGQAQINFMDNDISDPNGNWSQNQGHHDAYAYYFSQYGIDIDDFYWMSVSELKEGTGYTVDELTGAFQLCYERPRYDVAYGGYLFRTETANYYYNYLSNVYIPPSPLSNKLKFLYSLKPIWKRWLT